MAEIFGFFLEIVFRFLVEGILYGIWNGIGSFWYWLTGQSQKQRQVLQRRQKQIQKRRQAVDNLRRSRQKPKKKR